MFFEEERIPAIRRMIMADTEEERREALQSSCCLTRRVTSRVSTR